MKPFSETSIFDSAEDSFFTTGFVGGGENPNTFAGSLRNKEQIKISFNVKNHVRMLANTSSIYYFNVTNQQWNIPTASIPDHVGPFQRFSFNTSDIPSYLPGSGLTYPNDVTLGSFFVEDAKAFDAYGRCVVSGNLNINRRIDPSAVTNEYAQTIKAIGTDIETKEIVGYMTDDYVKSVQRSQIYDATADEVFTIGNDKPFLLEKVVIEVPMCMGSTWFQDRTATCYGRSSGTYNGSLIGTPPLTGMYDYFDRGGPALTFALFCQKKYGTNYIRDLIMSGTVTHLSDSIVTNNVRYLGLFARKHYVVESIGLRGASSVVESNTGVSSFTGSVFIKSTAAISNGSSRIFQMSTTLHGTNSTDYYTPSTMTSSFETIFRNENISLGDLTSKASSTNFKIAAIDPFGRGTTGFSPSGGSIFGKEYTTPQRQNEQIKNPLYVENVIELISSSLRLQNAIDEITTYVGSPLPASPIGTFIFCGDTSDFIAGQESPYLLNPGDQLVLSVSKTRPVTSSSYFDIPDAAAALIGSGRLLHHSATFGSQTGHDVTLSTGSINMTFYGSYVRQGSRYTP